MDALGNDAPAPSTYRTRGETAQAREKCTQREMRTYAVSMVMLAMRSPAVLSSNPARGREAGTNVILAWASSQPPWVRR